MVVLLIILLIVLFVNTAILIGVAVLLVKQSERLAELWEIAEAQRLGTSRLINWAGGVPPNQI